MDNHDVTFGKDFCEVIARVQLEGVFRIIPNQDVKRVLNMLMNYGCPPSAIMATIEELGECYNDENN